VLHTLFAAGAFNQDPAHCLGCCGEEMPPALPVGNLIAIHGTRKRVPKNVWLYGTAVTYRSIDGVPEKRLRLWDRDGNRPWG
jgi:hypothetical protein